MKLRKLYRKTMRRVARLILSYDRCPVDCRKDYKELLIMTVDILIVSIVFAILFGMLIVATL